MIQEYAKSLYKCTGVCQNIQSMQSMQMYAKEYKECINEEEEKGCKKQKIPHTGDIESLDRCG